MATNDPYRDDDYEAAFREDPSAQAAADAAETAAPEEVVDSAAAESQPADAGTPAVVEAEPVAVVVAEVQEPGDASAEKAANEAAAAEAKAVTDKANADAATNKQTEQTTGEQEAIAQSGKDAPKREEAPATEEADPYDLSDVPAEDLQKAKSWVGRLKKMEADLKAKAAPAQAQAQAPADDSAKETGDAIEQAADKAAAEGDAEKAQTVSEVADQVKAGEITPEEAMKILASDFGDDFVRMIEVVATNVASKAVNGRVSKLEEDTSAVRNSAERAHFEAIHGEHPDVMEITQEPEFKQYVEANGHQQIAERGSARQINKLLADYKASKQQAPAAAAAAPAAGADAPAVKAVAAAAKSAPAPVNQAAADAAEGVRSQGLRIPDKPGKSKDDFESAWKEF